MRLVWTKESFLLAPVSDALRRIKLLMPSGIPLAGELLGVPLLDESRCTPREIATLKAMVYMEIMRTAFYGESEIALKLNKPLGIDVSTLVKRGEAELIDA